MRLRQFRMRLVASLLVSAVSALYLHSATGQNAAGSARKPAPGPAPNSAPSNLPELNAGPTYTSGEGKDFPRFPNVEVVYSLTDPSGAPINANTGDLTLFSEGKKIGTASSIRSFGQTGYGLTAILVIDASGSMRGAPLAAIHASIAKFVNQARPQDQVEVLTIADHTQIDVPFGASKADLSRELETVQARGKYTRLYDGLLDALGQFNSTQPKRRQIVVISDGHDEGSKATLMDVALKAKPLGVVIDSIGLTRDAGQYLTSLQQLSKQTGGNYQRAVSAQDLDTMIGQGIQAKRATPVALFKTSHLPGDEKLHSVQIRWRPKSLSASTFIQTPKLNLFSNLWYWALGACFFAGLLLLILSWYGMRNSRRADRGAPIPEHAAATDFPPAPSAPPPFPERTPSYSPKPVESAHLPASGMNHSSAFSGQNKRSQTIAEPSWAEELVPEPVLSSAPFPNLQAKSQQASLLPDQDRARTQFAAFFERAVNGELARLQIRTGTLAGESIPIATPTLTLGATPASQAGSLPGAGQLVLPDDSTISAQHARLFWEGSILKIEDLNSTNGTYLNAVRLTPGRHLLKPGDEIRIGRTMLVVSSA